MTFCYAHRLLGGSTITTFLLGLNVCAGEQLITKRRNSVLRWELVKFEVKEQTVGN